VPEAVTAFLDSTDYENAVRLAISLGGDSDTLACITGGIAQAHYKRVPDTVAEDMRARMPQPMLDVVDRFTAKYGAAAA
jgi:ADP-ribosylglycohydrolase